MGKAEAGCRRRGCCLPTAECAACVGSAQLALDPLPLLLAHSVHSVPWKLSLWTKGGHVHLWPRAAPAAGFPSMPWSSDPVLCCAVAFCLQRSAGAGAGSVSCGRSVGAGCAEEFLSGIANVVRSARVSGTAPVSLPCASCFQESVSNIL